MLLLFLFKCQEALQEAETLSEVLRVEPHTCIDRCDNFYRVDALCNAGDHIRRVIKRVLYQT